MQLRTDTTGPVGLIDVQTDGAHPFGTTDARLPFPSALGVGTMQRFTLSDSLVVMLHQYTLTADVRLRRRAEAGDEPVITFSFRNVLRPAAQPADTQPQRLLPSVQVNSSDIDLDVSFPAGTQINTVIIGMHVALLAQLVGQQAGHPLVQSLLAGHQSYLYEAIGSPAMEQVAADLMAHNPADPLLTFYLTINAQALIYQFIHQLLKREKKVLYPLRDEEAKLLYTVRSQLVMDLSEPPSMPELARGAGMSESKLRRLFRQVFGLSLYDYYQTVRMREAARLLREAGLSVSETGYRLGFSNLSHFTRLFEKHVGQKPKRYASTPVDGPAPGESMR